MRPLFKIRYGEPHVPLAEIKKFRPGEAAKPEDFDPGDFILTRNHAWTGRIIRWGQGLRFRGSKRKYTWCNHAALIVSNNGDIIEAVRHGVEEDNLMKYTPEDCAIVHIDANQEDRHEVVAYAVWALKQEYAYLTIVSIAFSLIFGGKFSFFIDGQTICSGLVARALERTNVIFDRSPSHIMPADLASYFKVDPP
jgi:hypothetical protein